MAKSSADILARKQQQARMAAQRATAQTALSTNCCPTCGKSVRQNLSITGWVQCSQYGDGHFRADPNSPKCYWQGFTE